jgi:hypothetical protein
MLSLVFPLCIFIFWVKISGWLAMLFVHIFKIEEDTIYRNFLGWPISHHILAFAMFIVALVGMNIGVYYMHEDVLDDGRPLLNDQGYKFARNMVSLGIMYRDCPMIWLGPWKWFARCDVPPPDTLLSSFVRPKSNP